MAWRNHGAPRTAASLALEYSNETLGSNSI